MCCTGLLLEAGLISVKDLPMLAPLANMIPGAEMLLPMLPEPVQTLQKLGVSRLPLLLIHGDREIPRPQHPLSLAALPRGGRGTAPVPPNQCSIAQTAFGANCR